MPVKRIYVTKRVGYRAESDNLLNSLREDLGQTALENVLILNRYDVEGLTEAELQPALSTVFAEPMADELYLEKYPESFDEYASCVFAVEYLPGQYDQRSDSAEQCVKVVTGAKNVKIVCAKVYILFGKITKSDTDKIKKYVINEIDQREASAEKPDSLEMTCGIIPEVPVLTGFIKKTEKELAEFLKDMVLAMSIDDLKFAQNYFKNDEKRDPTETEIKLLDTYWSDHCRHTTFNTIINDIQIQKGSYKELFDEAVKIYDDMRSGSGVAESKSKTLMDMAVSGARYFRKTGVLNNVEVSEENNACSIEIDVKTTDGTEKWLLQFKNETHNHPTEIEPFGGAATCLGGAIRDPLSGRAYVYHAMRITGSGDPRTPIEKTIPGKLSQRKITRDAAAGFSSYGNQIGLATGYVGEYYHEGFTAKRMETGAVIGAVPKDWVRRETPKVGDIIILLGGRTGRDGIGGATGSSKEHNVASLALCGAEVQKGNAPEEHKILRLFRRKEATRLIKKCNDFGAGGVAVAIGELADGLLIDLNAVPKKYDGLTGTEIAIAESQERMAVVVEEKDVENFMKFCRLENLEATKVAKVTASEKLQMTHNGRFIVDIARTFLDSAGASRFAKVSVENPSDDNFLNSAKFKGDTFEERASSVLSDLNVCSNKGLTERFDSTVGAGSVMTPFGGIYGDTPCEYMAAKIPVMGKDTTTVSVMACGYDPDICSWSPYHGALYAVISSAAKTVAAGAKLKDIRLSFQEYFERLDEDPVKWGKPFAALLGSLKAQKELGIGAIGGKDSMSGTFKDKSTGKVINVPPTLLSFAVAPSDIERVITQEFKKGGDTVYLIKTDIDESGMINFESFKENISTVEKLIEQKNIEAIYTVKSGGVMEAICKMAFGNRIGVAVCSEISLDELSRPYYGSFIIETKSGCNFQNIDNLEKIGVTLSFGVFKYKLETVELDTLKNYWTEPLEKIFPSQTYESTEIIIPQDFAGTSKLVKAKIEIKPRVAILALPGINCEYDTKRAFELAGSFETDPFVFCNANTQEALESCENFAKIINNAQILAVPGGFSAGDEPEGSGKFFVSVFKHKKVREAIDNLINKRDGLVIGICNGFQAILKTGLLTYGYVQDLDENDATLTFNKIGRHVSQMVRTRVASVNSPWMALRKIGEIDIVPVSHGEGRFVASKELMEKYFQNGQILFQYVDITGNITMESPFNPNGSEMAVEGICSPCGRVLGKMAHGERLGNGIHINNAYGNMEQHLFEAGVRYFTGK